MKVIRGETLAFVFDGVNILPYYPTTNSSISYINKNNMEEEVVCTEDNILLYWDNSPVTVNQQFTASNLSECRFYSYTAFFSTKGEGLKIKQNRIFVINWF